MSLLADLGDLLDLADLDRLTTTLPTVLRSGTGSQKDASSRVGSLRRRASTGCTSGRLEDVRVFFPPMFFVVFRLSL